MPSGLPNATTGRRRKARGHPCLSSFHLRFVLRENVTQEINVANKNKVETNFFLGFSWWKNEFILNMCVYKYVVYIYIHDHICISRWWPTSWMNKFRTPSFNPWWDSHQSVDETALNQENTQGRIFFWGGDSLSPTNGALQSEHQVIKSIVTL